MDLSVSSVTRIDSQKKCLKKGRSQLQGIFLGRCPFLVLTNISGMLTISFSYKILITNWLRSLRSALISCRGNKAGRSITGHYSADYSKQWGKMSWFSSGKIVYNNVLFLPFLSGDKHLLHLTENQFMYLYKRFSYLLWQLEHLTSTFDWPVVWYEERTWYFS